MEHLLVASNPIIPSIRVPYVCEEIYQIGRFPVYPLDQGFELTTGGLVIVREEQRKEVGSLLQEWLYFGLLEEFLGRNVVDDFVSYDLDGGFQLIQTSLLPKHLRVFREELSAMTKDERHKVCLDLDSLLKFAATQCRSLDQDHGWTRKYHLPTILLSIRLLIDTLAIALADIDNSTDLSTNHQWYPLCHEVGDAPPSTSILLDHMVKSGWCVHQARFFCQRFSYSVVYYLATFRRIIVARGHEACKLEDHCVANNTNARTYEYRHVEEGCRCELLPSPVNEVKEIIRDGGIPLIAFSHTPTGEIQQKVVRAKLSSWYTAVSHVWSDGLGNPNQNALPKCQIERLVRKVKKADIESGKRRAGKPQLCFGKRDNVDDTVNIWMDTLCIPVNDSGLKMKAINRMTPTYKRAVRVLVLDSTLNLVAPTSNPTEKCAQLLMSAWNGRSWTLQEGALAAELMFPISDCKELFYRPFKWNSDMAKYIYKELHQAHQLPSVGQWKKEGGVDVRESQFLGVWNALLGRTTTMSRDVHGIFANLLDFHAEEILLLHEKNRMKALLCSQERLPVQLLYNDSARGFAQGPLDRWVPDFPKGSPIFNTDTWMDVTNTGLLIGGDNARARTIIIRNDGNQEPPERYSLNVEGVGKFWVTTHLSKPTKESSYPPFKRSVTILHLDKDVMSILGLGVKLVGASFSVVEEQSARFKVIFENPITLELWGPISQDVDSKDCLCLDGNVLFRSQEILIDIGKSIATEASCPAKITSTRNNSEPLDSRTHILSQTTNISVQLIKMSGRDYYEGGGQDDYGSGGRQQGGYGGQQGGYSGEGRGQGGYGGQQGGYGGEGRGGGGYGGQQGGYGGGGNVPQGGNYGGGGGYGGNDDDLQGAAHHAQQHAGDSGDSSVFSSVLGKLAGNKQNIQQQPIDEQDAVQSHKQFFGGGGGQQQPASAGSMGSAAAMQALKMFSGGGSGGSQSGNSQNAFVGMAMGQASKLFDSQASQGNVQSGASKESAIQQAGEMALKMYMQSQGSSGGASGLMGLASKFL
ncbi:hypothetical protein G7Y89_g2946 [Cudoniella acicularis]|uniref:DUF7721 domain-containing protein n=1 Tax=Cudoniella acicularis TaxID=354080 RepID=A0A8H4RSB7_9HELO|nr:hypothetical protein G7Y89_g2946 [Cudoniella acicularis]